MVCWAVCNWSISTVLVANDHLQELKVFVDFFALQMLTSLVWNDLLECDLLEGFTCYVVKYDSTFGSLQEQVYMFNWKSPRIIVQQ